MDKEKLSENIKVRLTPTQKAQLQQLLQEQGIKSLSEFVREIILTGEYKVKSEKCKEYESDLLYHLNRIGNNLNQVARYVNSTKELDRKVLNELIKIRELLEIVSE